MAWSASRRNYPPLKGLITHGVGRVLARVVWRAQAHTAMELQETGNSHHPTNHWKRHTWKGMYVFDKPYHCIPLGDQPPVPGVYYCIARIISPWF